MGEVDTQANRALDDLVHWRGQLADLVSASGRLNASGTALLDRATVETVLEKAVARSVGFDELTAWAQAVHFLEDLDLEQDQEDLLTQFLFEASTPELFEAVTAEFCLGWLSRIRSSLNASKTVGR